MWSMVSRENKETEKESWGVGWKSLSPETSAHYNRLFETSLSLCATASKQTMQNIVKVTDVFSHDKTEKKFEDLFGNRLPINFKRLIGLKITLVNFTYPNYSLLMVFKNFLFENLVDCKTVGFFLKISKEIGKAWRKSRESREKKRIFSVSPQSRSLFTASFRSFCLTARASLNTKNYCFAV